ncbi:MAG: glycerol kinase GlpK [Oleibacter sp.]|nr:glycerol kinase GlpK [Thalassolituus sp.]
MTRYILSFDQGTTSSRVMIFDSHGQVVATAQQEFAQHFPQSGWVEHDPQDLWQSSLECAREAIRTLSSKISNFNVTQLSAIGITNQRETTLVWERASGKPVYPAIVWQDRRTADICRQWLPFADTIREKTGLLLDPYFSASKIRWILDHIDHGQARAEAGELVFGTVDTWLIWQLTQGAEHVTDATNASRTMMFDIHQQQWDSELLSQFKIPSSMLPRVCDSAAHFGDLDLGLIDESWTGTIVPIAGVAGDQQAALIGQGCWQRGMVKSTYGTGCFVVANTGEQALTSNYKLLTTVAYRLNGQVTYALEGSIFMAGATIQWLRDGLKIIDNAGMTEAMAENTGYSHSVYMVPAFVGLGAPYWDADARGAILGLTRDSGIQEIVTAGLQAVCYQTRDLLEAMAKDGVSTSILRVDGGMVKNNWLMQCLADTLGVSVERPAVTETTALGAAMLAGIYVGLYSPEQSLLPTERTFECKLDDETREFLYEGWLASVKRIGNNQEPLNISAI